MVEEKSLKTRYIVLQKCDSMIHEYAERSIDFSLNGTIDKFLFNH